MRFPWNLICRRVFKLRRRTGVQKTNLSLFKPKCPILSIACSLQCVTERRLTRNLNYLWSIKVFLSPVALPQCVYEPVICSVTRCAWRLFIMNFDVLKWSVLFSMFHLPPLHHVLSWQVYDINTYTKWLKWELEARGISAPLKVKVKPAHLIERHLQSWTRAFLFGEK